MSFATNQSQQISLFDATANLTDREKRLLEKSWAKYFAENIFPEIDEKPFSVLYSDRPSRHNTWDAYPLITARIMRLGSLKSVSAYNYNNGNTRTDSNDATYILPRYTETSLKQKLNTISKPDVILHRENGQFITNDLLYDISWGAITDEYQKQDLGGYLITVALKSAAEETQQAQTHYYYVKDCQINRDEIGLDLDALETAGVVVSVTDDYICEDDRCSTKINLSDFNTNDIVEISVKAIARKRAEVYENGAEGVSMDLTIPDRLKVPDTEKLSKTLALGGLDVTNNPDNPIIMDVYNGGLAFGYETGTYPEATDAEMKMAVALYTDKPQGAENDKSTVSEAWDAGANQSLYTKGEPFSLGKMAENHPASIVYLTEFERYPGEFAGKWLKIALQATSATKIDSQWTDQDIADRTINYVWMQIPKIQLNNVNLIDLGATDGKEDVVRYACDGNLSDVSTDVNRETQIFTKSLSFEEERNVNGYSVSVNGIPVTEDSPVPVYNIYMQRHLTDENDAESFDGSWDVYLQSNSVIVTPPTELKPECEQNVGATWVGRIGKTFDTNPDDNIPAEIYPMIQFDCIGVDYPYGSQQNQSCYIPMQLRYQVDEQSGRGSFILVLPDVTKVNETSLPGDNFTSGVVVSQYLKEERPYVIGVDGTYVRTLPQP